MRIIFGLLCLCCVSLVSCNHKAGPDSSCSCASCGGCSECKSGAGDCSCKKAAGVKVEGSCAMHAEEHKSCGH